MPVNRTTDTTGTFQTYGNLYEQWKQAADIVRICREAGLEKEFINSRCAGNGIKVAWKYNWERFTSSQNEGERGTFWSGLEIKVTSEKPSESVKKLIAGLRDYVVQNWRTKKPESPVQSIDVLGEDSPIH